MGQAEIRGRGWSLWTWAPRKVGRPLDPWPHGSGQAGSSATAFAEICWWMQHRFPAGARRAIESGQAVGGGRGRGRHWPGQRTRLGQAGHGVPTACAVDPVLRRWVRPTRAPARERADRRAARRTQARAGVRAASQAPPSRPAGDRCTKQLCRAPGPPSHAFASANLLGAAVASAQRCSPAADDVAARCVCARAPRPARPRRKPGAAYARPAGAGSRRSNQPSGASAHQHGGRGVSLARAEGKVERREERAHRRWAPGAAVLTCGAASPVFRAPMTSQAAVLDACAGRAPPAWCEHPDMRICARPNLVTAPAPTLASVSTFPLLPRPSAHRLTRPPSAAAQPSARRTPALSCLRRHTAIPPVARRLLTVEHTTSSRCTLCASRLIRVLPGPSAAH